MLVTCPNCETSFTPALRRCPGCGAWEPTAEQMDQYRIHHAATALTAGKSPRMLRRSFIEDGCDPETADDLLHAAQKCMRRTNRRRGARVMGKGFLLLCLSPFVFVVSLLFPVGVPALVFCVIGGGFLFVCGLAMRITGQDLE